MPKNSKLLAKSLAFPSPAQLTFRLSRLPRRLGVDQRKKMKPVLVIALTFGLVAYSDSQGTRQDSGPKCTTPDSKPGTCINIRVCPTLLNLIRNQGRNPEAIDFVNSSNDYRSGCGYDPQSPSVPLVCCPSTTADYNNLPSPPDCGETEVWDHDKVIGGSPATLGAWPWIAVLGYKSNKNPGPSWKCGGTLVTKRYVLTAAHCAFPQGWRLYLVRLGELNLDRKVNDGANPIDIMIEKIIAHESYSSKQYNDDIALIRLRQEAPLSIYIQPICLPKTQELKQKNFTGFSPFIAGWGATQLGGSVTKHLMEVQIPIWENQPCKEKYILKKANISHKQLCAGDVKGEKDSCQGDSGGPMMWPKGANYYLLGVVSYGFQCAHPEYPGVYTRVTEYIDWISKTIVV